MSSLAIVCGGGSLSGLGSPPAGDTGQKVLRQTQGAIDELKRGVTAGPSGALNDLHALAKENDTEVRRSATLAMAQRFLLALPRTEASPELAMDDDGEVCFDWKGPSQALLTIALGQDGRLSYAFRASQFDKVHGTSRFVDAIPKNVVDLVHRVNRA